MAAKKSSKNTSGADDQIETLWSVLPHPEDSVVRLFCRKGNERDGDFAHNVPEVRQFARAYQDRNVYVALNPTRSTSGVRHSAADVTHWSYFLIDIDPVKKECNPMIAVEEALLWLGEWLGRDFNRLRPIIIDSGRGAQAWVRLADVPLLAGDDVRELRLGNGKTTTAVTRKLARRVNGYWLKRLDEKLGLCRGCKIDTSVSDLPRVMRCPGTINIKTGRAAKFVHATDRMFEGMATLLVTGTPSRELWDPEPVKGVLAGQPWQMVFAHLTLSAQTYLTRGKEEPGRHKVMWHTAKKLAELGVTREEAGRALRWANALAGKDEELDQGQVKHALDTAYGT